MLLSRSACRNEMAKTETVRMSLIEDTTGAVMASHVNTDDEGYKAYLDYLRTG